MPKRIEEFINNEIYHITIRGVDGRLIFLDDEDRWRGIFSLYEFNNANSVTIRRQREKREKFKKSIQSRRFPTPAVFESITQSDKRDKIVDVLSFVFMPNHIHLLLRQLKEKGISVFMQKIGSGYTNFFNSKHKRSGHLFQGAFQSRCIGGDDYLKNVFVYIHTNPVSIIEPGWKEKGVSDPKTAIEFLENYRWSSYPDYLNQKNFPSITERDFLLKIFGSSENAKNFVDAWVASKNSVLL